MVQATFELSEAALASLEALAAERGKSQSDLVELAILELKFKQRLSPEEWQARWQALTEDVAAHMPPDVSPEEIEAEITAATNEVWAERRAARRS